MIDKELFDNLYKRVKEQGLRIFVSLDKFSGEISYGFITDEERCIYFQNGVYKDGLQFSTVYRPNSKTGCGTQFLTNVYDCSGIDFKAVLNNCKTDTSEKYLTMQEYLDVSAHAKFIEHK